MQNVLSIFRYLRVFVVFLSLQIFALYLYFNSDVYPSIQFVNSTSGITSTFLEIQHSYTQYFGLMEENKRLRKAYQDLLDQNRLSLIKITADTVAIQDTVYKQEFSYIRGDVLKATTHKADNYITANIGTKQGVKRGMGAINHDGLIGFVFEVSEHYCLIKTLLSKDINIDVSLNKSGQFGFLKWPGQKYNAVSISGIPNDIEVKIGELVVTRGTGGVFPRGIPVGTVSAMDYAEGEANWNLIVKPSVNFRAVKHVYVVNHLLKDELEELESRVP